jgi:hypothetical protein
LRHLIIAIAATVIALAAGSNSRAASDKPNETFWELLDKRDFHVTVEPWPAKAGGTIRIHGVADEKSKDPWQPMKQSKGKAGKDVNFDLAAKLPSADKVFIQFKIKPSGSDQPLELTDWSINLEK